ncbi:MAG: hypothetical protein IVW55_12105 [Chloroflexi bacterium]|nr:hypothetical protein [Chloroflexota bacterium]
MDTAVGLVKTYLELCGYFVLAELPVRVHDEAGKGYRDLTDLDVIAVRFPHARHEYSGRDERQLEVFLGADPVLGSFTQGLDIIVGEVKEGQGRVNPALRRAQTVAFALRRTGSCPEEMVEEEARAVAVEGARSLVMPGGTSCMVRLVAFAGQGGASSGGIHTVSLTHCMDFIQQRLLEGRDVLAGAQFKDPVLGLLSLQSKLLRGSNSPTATRATLPHS